MVEIPVSCCFASEAYHCLKFGDLRGQTGPDYDLVCILYPMRWVLTLQLVPKVMVAFLWFLPTANNSSSANMCLVS